MHLEKVQQTGTSGYCRVVQGAAGHCYHMAAINITEQAAAAAAAASLGFEVYT